MSELILLIILLLVTIGLLIVINNYSKDKITVYVTFLMLVSYILSFRNISFIGMNINANIILYTSIIPALYIYIEKEKNINTKEVLKESSIILLITLFLLMLTAGYMPSVTDNNAINIQNTFGNNFVILIAYPLILTVSLYLTFIFHNKLKDLYPNNFLTLLILGSIVTTIDIILYSIITNIFTLSLINILSIITVTYVIRLMVLLTEALIIDKCLPKKKVKK